ncbi:MAG TPA: MlaD family protein, partial [Actinomycetota bacterium]|nr:MlaD family protein [Actinomycetota bacterium]
EDGHAVVTFDVDRDTELTTTSRVAIRWRNVIGLRFLYVYPGEGGEPLDDGDRIPLARTDSAGDIGELLNNLGPVLKAIDPEKANAFLDAMNTALAGNEEIVRALLTEGAVLAGDLGDLDQEIQTLITSSDEILAAYAGQDRNIGRIIDDLNNVAGELSGMREAVNSLIVNFAVVQQELDGLLKRNRENIDVDLRLLDSVLGTLKENRQRLHRVLCSVPPGVVPYDFTSSWGEWFNVRIVQFVVKDEEGNVIAFQREDPESQRPDRGPRPIDCPRGAPEPVNPAAQADPRAPEEPQPVGIDGLFDAVTGGRDG